MSTFDDFWIAYPNKKGKGAALKSWTRLKPSEALVERIMRAINEQKGWEQWQKGFIPMPSTWLNQQRWLDEDKVALKPPAPSQPITWQLRDVPKPKVDPEMVEESLKLLEDIRHKRISREQLISRCQMMHKCWPNAGWDEKVEEFMEFIGGE